LLGAIAAAFARHGPSRCLGSERPRADQTDLCWTDAEGVAHHPIVLLDEHKEPVGVIVLAGCTIPNGKMRAFATALGQAL
jgi:hypothetical protein